MKIFINKVSKEKPSSKTTSLQLIDSTTTSLNKTCFPWAKFRKTKSGIKLHLNLCYLDKDNQYPERFTITNASKPSSEFFTIFNGNDTKIYTYLNSTGNIVLAFTSTEHSGPYTSVVLLQRNIWVKPNKPAGLPVGLFRSSI
ncbi:transposase [Enterococcus sp. AZ135]|uniref:hypothetical protein n=1 Tax=unclassified Enterococcus TaxID=2608891 RepID=UPI003F289016